MLGGKTFAERQTEQKGRDYDADISKLKMRIAELEGRVERLRVALGWFVADDRFRVGVGGNPNAVEPMIEEARRIYKNA